MKYLLLFLIVSLCLLFFYLRKEIRIIFIFLKELLYKDTAEERLRKILLCAGKIEIYSQNNLSSLEHVKPITKKEFISNIEKSIPSNSLTKEEIYKHLQSPYSHYYKNFVVSTTSGTSGEMGIFINNEESWIKTQAVLFDKLFYPYITDFIPYIFTGITCIFVVADNGHFMTRKIAIPVLNMFLINTIILSLFDENLVNKINSYNPQILHMYPSNLENIYLNLFISPIIITTGSEKLTKNLRNKLSIRFPKTKIIETYGSTECVFIGSSCKFGNIHIHDDVCIVEAIDKYNNIITEKYIKSDKIYITNLINNFSPIIRYEMNDSIEYIECCCNKSGPAIIVHGRSDDILHFFDPYGKMQKHSPISIETIFVSIPYNFSYQIVHKQQNFLLINIKYDEVNKLILYNIISRNIRNYLDNCELYNVQFQIHFNEFFIIGKNGKTRQIINLV
jgi:phenylacetate-CoA ligase